MAGSGPNLYPYAGNNPTSYVDPSGMFAQALVAVGSAVAIGFGTGYAVDHLAGPQAYSGDTSQRLGTPAYTGDTWTTSGGMADYAGDTGHLLQSKWADTFFKAYPYLFEKVVVHHAVPRDVLKQYPGRFTEEEMHALGNLREICKEERAFHG